MSANAEKNGVGKSAASPRTDAAAAVPALPLKKVAVWLAVAIGLVWAGSLTGTFHFDDTHSVESNIAVRSLTNIPSFWTDTRTSSFIPENRVYRPLVYTFYAFCWQIGGGKTWPFHLMKMGFHLLVCLALFLIWCRLWSQAGWFPSKPVKLKPPLFSQTFVLTPQWAAFFLALIFAVHPACSECVDYISATTSLQCAMFYVWAYYCYLLYRDTRQSKLLWGSLGLYFLSVASKEEGITLPAMVFFTEMFLAVPVRIAPRLKIAIRSTIPYALLAAVLAAWIYVMHPVSGNESRGWNTPFEYFITQWRSYLWYMRLWFWPWDFNADSAAMVFSHSLSDPLVIQAAIGNLAILAFAWFQRKRWPAMLFGLVWFYVTISPASSVVVLAEAVNEHRMYLSYVGFVGGTFVVLLSLVDALFTSDKRASRLGWVYVLILAGLIKGAQERNWVWANDENLWVDTVEKNPTSGRALNNLGLVYLSRGEYEKAVDLFDQCEKNWTTYMYCPLNEGVASQGIGVRLLAEGKADQASQKFDAAEKSYLRAYNLDPRSVHSNFHLGLFYQEVRKDCDKAIAHFRQSVDGTGGRYPDADVRMARCLAGEHRYDEARAALKEALSVEPKNEDAAFELGKLEIGAGNESEAVDIYKALVKLDPNHLGAWYNLGVAALSKNDMDTALRAFERTVTLDPKSEQGWYNLSVVAEKTRDGDRAVEAAGKLVSLNPSNSEYQSRLRDLEKKFGKANG